jgi:hypothetical protein
MDGTTRKQTVPVASEAGPRRDPASSQSMADYYSLISEAVAKLPTNTGDAREALYDRARKALATQLEGHEASQIATEQFALEAAILRVEGEASARHSGVPISRRPRVGLSSPIHQPTTALLVISIFLFRLGWFIDVTCMSLYWVARIPRHS